MRILAIETSTLTGSIALTDGGRLLAETTLSVSVQHSERLMPAIEQILKDAEMEASAIDLYAVAEGPGSFTGLRIGIAAAQGMAMAHGKPLRGVSTLQGLAMNAAFFPGLVVPVLNAFRGEIYFGVYRMEKGVPVAVQDDGVTSVDHFVSQASSWTERAVVLGNGVDLIRPLVEAASDGSKDGKITIISGPLNTPRASHLATLASLSGSLENENPVLPRYLRKPG